ncbi:MAG: hypothetical protein KBS65_00215, partial [Prevotella sp.]|nr:hypothetical protein [Candidatus Equicola stercoris]
IGANARINDDVWIESIWPEKRVLEHNATDNVNELNTVYIIHYGKIKVMVTGDLTTEDEAKILDRYRGKDTLQCDVLKVGHHGSKTSSSDEFLDAVNPRIAVISVGAHNSYGHPNQEILDRLQNHGIAVYRTDINGAVGVDIRGTVLMGILCTGGQSLKVDTMR